MVEQGGAAHGGGKLPAEDAAVVAAVSAAVALRPSGGCDLAVGRGQRRADATRPAVGTFAFSSPSAELLLTGGELADPAVRCPADDLLGSHDGASSRLNSGSSSGRRLASWG